MNKLKNFKMIDSSDSYTTSKERLFDLPMRLLIIGKTGDSKSTTLARMLLDPNFYKDDFVPENIYIFSGSFKGDNKLNIIKRELDIPDENIINGYDENMIELIYDNLVEEFIEKTEDGEKDSKKLNSLLVFDDLAWSGELKADRKEHQLTRIFMNGRKFLISCIVISQKYTAVGTTLRENASGLILGKSSNKQLDSIGGDHNYMENPKDFNILFKKTTNIPYGKFVINFSEPQLYFNESYEPLVDKI